MRERAGTIPGAAFESPPYTPPVNQFADVAAWAPIGLFRVRRDGTFLAANRRLAEMLGYAGTEDLLARNLERDIYFDPAQRRTLLALVEIHGAALRLEARWRTRSGSTIWVELTGHALPDEEGAPAPAFEGLDGLEATAEIQRTAPRPVVLLTAHESPDLVARAGRAGQGGYLVKPTTPEELERTLAIALARFGDLVELRRLNRELSDALASVKMLSGLLPICANCKKIRDDRGYWVAVEVYIMAHTEARFSHGCCPECRQKLYPGMANGG